MMNNYSYTVVIVPLWILIEQRCSYICKRLKIGSSCTVLTSGLSSVEDMYVGDPLCPLVLIINPKKTIELYRYHYNSRYRPIVSLTPPAVTHTWCNIM